MRVLLPWIGFEKLLASAFDQIRFYARADVAVSLRLLRALDDIGTCTPGPEDRRALLELGQRIVAGCEGRLEERDLAALRVRLARIGGQ